jgi:uncharacterized repeat protein (TIGR02543 family)
MKKKYFLPITTILLVLCSCSIQSHEHTYSDTWSHDKTYHYHEATCGHDVKKDEEKHTFVDTVVAPTYGKDGYTKHTCSICEYTYTDAVTPKLDHSYSGVWSHDGSQHWHACADSGYETLKADIADHDFTETVISPTYDEEGYTLHECSVCKYSYKSDYSDKLIRTYNLVLNFNGGTSLSHGSSFSKTIQSFSKDDFFYDLYKDGYIFRGWEYKGEVVVNENGVWNITPNLEDTMTFTAVFSDKVNLNINANIEGAGTVEGNGEHVLNTFVSLNATPAQGYKFTGWYNEGTLLSDNKQYTFKITKDTNLEARFSLDSFTLTISSNNLTYGEVLPIDDSSSQKQDTYTLSKDYTDSIAIKAVTKTDSVSFLGWYDENNNLVSSDSLYTFTMPNHDYSLVAKWDYFKIEYNLNGGVNSGDNVDHYSTDKVPTLNNPTKKGYTFLGWKYKGNFVTSIDSSWLADISLDAIWETTTYNVTYHLDGGTNNSGNPKTFTIESEHIALASPTKKGYNFMGWYTSSSLSDETSITAIAKGSTEDVNLYAKWEIITYTITYNVGLGENDSSNPKTYTVEDEIALANATRDGYAFTGWKGDGGVVDKISKGTVGNLTLTAMWSTNLNSLTVSTEDQNMGSAKIISGEGYTDEEVTVKATVNSGYLFKGWYEGDTKVSPKEEYTFTMGTTDKTLVAKFHNKDEVKEIYKNQGRIPVVSSDSKTVTYGLYPQTVVSDTELIRELDKLTTTASNGWYLYDNTYYAKQSVTKYVSDWALETVGTYKFSDGSEVVTGDTRWFKCEPISWKVLTISTTGSSYYTYSLVSNLILDNQRFNERFTGQNEKGYYANNYEQSEIRSWLNGEFYDLAFGLDKSYIKTIKIDNSESSTQTTTSNPYVCNNTDDNVYLLSDADYQNTSYGFSTETSSDKASLRCQVTDYSLAKSIQMYDRTDYSRCGTYYTRSPIDKVSTQASLVEYWGSLFSGREGDNTYGIYKDYYVDKYEGVRPGITINVPIEN